MPKSTFETRIPPHQRKSNPENRTDCRVRSRNRFCKNREARVQSRSRSCRTWEDRVLRRRRTRTIRSPQTSKRIARWSTLSPNIRDQTLTRMRSLTVGESIQNTSTAREALLVIRFLDPHHRPTVVNLHPRNSAAPFVVTHGTISIPKINRDRTDAGTETTAEFQCTLKFELTRTASTALLYASWDPGIVRSEQMSSVTRTKLKEL